MSYPSPQHTQAYSGEPPLWAPLYGATLPQAVQRFFKKYATFSGRASRSEYWWWALVSVGVSIVLQIIMYGAGAGQTDMYGNPTMGPGMMLGMILLVIWGLATVVPSLALTVRRLHDANYPGTMILLGLIPFVGGIILLVLVLMGSKPEGQRFDQPA